VGGLLGGRLPLDAYDDFFLFAFGHAQPRAAAKLFTECC